MQADAAGAARNPVFFAKPSRAVSRASLEKLPAARVKLGVGRRDAVPSYIDIAGTVKSVLVQAVLYCFLYATWTEMGRMYADERRNHNSR